MLAKRCAEHGPIATRPQARHQPSAALTKIARYYRAMACRSLRHLRGNVGLMQASSASTGERASGSPPTPCVDQGGDPESPALVSLDEDGPTVNQKKCLQPAQGQEQDLRAGRGRPAPPTSQADRQAPGVTEQTWST